MVADKRASHAAHVVCTARPQATHLLRLLLCGLCPRLCVSQPGAVLLLPLGRCSHSLPCSALLL